ncbi:hypothetical protein [Jannaschia sp. CCS1]|uniref:hypothetical protein n=1 Tax=Jannaschia sp. (strain CCS1) TaxID=290400 RepID=UPI000053D517|nr:hypothetical protein [Jannaschia sp. CCS1]ABD55812.1 hypothetical protein Jann_2895 [Jannaschia sp. CCS1]
MDENRFDAVARRVSDGTPGGPAYRVGRRGLKIVEELAARGVAEATMAKALRMGKDAFRAAKRRDPAVQEAIDRGRAVEHDKLVGVLHDLAMEGQYVPAMFLLKARHGYREGEQFEANVNLSIDTGGVLVVPNKMSMEEFLEAQRQAGTYDSPIRPDAVKRIPGEPEVVVDPETRRGD